MLKYPSAVFTPYSNASATRSSSGLRRSAPTTRNGRARAVSGAKAGGGLPRAPPPSEGAPNKERSSTPAAERSEEAEMGCALARKNSRRSAGSRWRNAPKHATAAHAPGSEEGVEMAQEPKGSWIG